MLVQLSLSKQSIRQAINSCYWCQRAVSSVFYQTAMPIFGSLLMLVSIYGSASPVDVEHQTIRIAMTQEPPSLDSTRTTDLVSFFVLGHINEGLLRYDRRGALTGGVAENWEVAPTRITFKLRTNARWHDGSQVRAQDFVFGWRLVADPEQASPFAAIMDPVKNGQAIREGRLPVTSLGVSAVDDTTLVVDFERPCGYCLTLMPHSIFFPVNERFYRASGEKYGTQARHLLSNGPFILDQWTHDASLNFNKNPMYWNADAVSLNQIEVAYISSDNRTRLNLFMDEQIAFARLGAETVREAVNQGYRVRTFLSGGVAYLWFNMREGRATRNRTLRQAIQASFDSHEYVNQVIAIPGYRPTETLFPSWLRGTSGSFTEEYPPPSIERSKAQAVSLLQQAQAEAGETQQLTLLTVSSTTGLRAAEYLQGRLQQILGIDVKVDQQTFKQYLNKARGGDFDLVLSSWYPDYNDIVTYADLLASYNPNNRGRYVNAEYDRQLQTLISESDPVKRFKAAGMLQALIVRDVPVLPTAETSSAFLQHRQLKGVVRRVFGPDPDFTSARVVP